MKTKVLVIEDEMIMRVTIVDALLAEGYEAVGFERGLDGLRALSEGGAGVLVSDVRLPDIDGIDVLKQAKTTSSATEVIIITAHGSIKSAVEAMRLGAFDYIIKPFALDELRVVVARALEVGALRDENHRLKQRLDQCQMEPRIIGDSAAIKTLLSLIRKVALTDSSVLILGESGTGKELVASAIHQASHRREEPFVAINCAALPEALIESELFGYEKGAFTGALKRKPGKFELASKGTLFLDEVADMPLSVQSKLLRVLQEGAVERLGGTEPIKIDVRVVAATNKPLKDEIAAGRLREDLYYRLNVIPIEVPPLRDRADDVPLLAMYFLKKYSDRAGRKLGLSRNTLSVLMDYSYPGNVRELENLIERLVTLCEGQEIMPSDMPSHIFDPSKTPVSPASLSDVSRMAEREHILRVISITGGNRTRAAELLGISRKTLWEKMNSYGISHQDVTPA